MPSGIRAEITLENPPDCVVTQAAIEADGRVHSVSKSTNPETPDRVAEEFRLEAETYPDSFELEPEPTEVFAYGSSAVYSFQRDLGYGCPCEVVESFDCPVTDVRVHDGSLHLTFHAPDMHGLQAIIGDLRDQYALDVKRLLQSQQDHADEHLVFVDRSTLTDRQLEVLETAHRMGYFDHPKGANAGEVADELEITGTTFTEHLAAAQTKLLDAILAHGD
ncbi:helix-turn-helix domain-containing protein [Natrarchaeobaculum sulfurireducens]|uniref:Bacterio-opsin activator domain-containing protein n=1 Tax=Natrarchaeobaculum sulfurireducens TaxID=2044521 RepID=A0A346PI54_9EURY|nr:helix-turn-helix domain-containing protein [Natrarchaeobaculum sulfurireducens]AXR79199.1 Transcriptional regulator, contains HTH domain [Natrarchaeobaculum sulfurireducens]AXR80755.1 Bacterio-opsin activator domain-containing protein [Natrarchaeobaculum sulfurireducens]